MLVAAGPETGTADLMRIRLARYPIRQVRNAAGMGRSGAAGETRDCEVGAAPEEMHGTALADEARPEFLEHALCLQQHTPVSVHVLRIVCTMRCILVERNRIGQLVRHRV